MLYKSMRDLITLIESELTRTVRLDDLYSSDELFDEEEMLGRFGLDNFGNRGWEKACSYPLAVKTLSAVDASNNWLNRGHKLAHSFKNATGEQRKIVADKAKNFDDSRIVVMDGNNILDGNHHAVAAIKIGKPINYVNLQDLPETI